MMSPDKIMTHDKESIPLQFRSKSPEHSFSDFLLFSKPVEQFHIQDYRWKNLSMAIKCMIYLQKIYGLRFSDVARITPKDVADDGLIYLAGTKKSHSKLIYFPPIFAIFGRDWSPDRPIFSVNYRRYYSCIKRLNLDRHLAGHHINRTVTHIFRHDRFGTLPAIFPVSFADVKRFSGHKSDAGLSYYLKPIK